MGQTRACSPTVGRPVLAHHGRPGRAEQALPPAVHVAASPGRSAGSGRRNSGGDDDQALRARRPAPGRALRRACSVPRDGARGGPAVRGAHTELPQSRRRARACRGVDPRSFIGADAAACGARSAAAPRAEREPSLQDGTPPRASPRSRCGARRQSPLCWTRQDGSEQPVRSRSVSDWRLDAAAAKFRVSLSRRTPACSGAVDSLPPCS
mmetsp:Transcript_22105/g.71353  ORF Transcript_22105/g.71353 Transcript_22105/m.71353 type:complete len:209 (-) Transcript_22105:58-684(-)